MPVLALARVAAFACRSAQALLGRGSAGDEGQPDGRLQLYVDDPLWVTRGIADQRRRNTVILLLFWQAFGFPFSW